VKLIDVYPNEAQATVGVEMAGYQMLLGVEVMRGKYRNSFSDPEPMIPDQITPVSFHIHDRFHTFKKGHRIMVHVHSSWFPAFDRNPQTFTNIYRAKKNEYQKATQKIYRSQKSPSHIVLPVLE
jgi:putative CocE/NonD family hydrolase